MNRSIVDNQRMVVSAIQKSPYYIELEDANMHFERYTDKYTKEKDNTKLAAFYSYDILSKYIPTGRSRWCVVHLQNCWVTSRERKSTLCV